MTYIICRNDVSYIIYIAGIACNTYTSYIVLPYDTLYCFGCLLGVLTLFTWQHFLVLNTLLLLFLPTSPAHFTLLCCTL